MTLKFAHKSLAATLVAGLLAACGGGGGGGGGTPVLTQAPAANAAPTVTLTADQTTAVDAKNEAVAGYGSAAATTVNPILAGAAQQAEQLSVLRSAQPVAEAVPEACPDGGSADISGTSNSYVMRYVNCTTKYTYGSTTHTYVLNGSMNVVFSKMPTQTSQDMAFTMTYNLTATVDGESNTMTGTSTCDITAGVTSCTFTDANRTWSSGMRYDKASRTLNGSYAGNWKGGVVKVTYTNFTATSGTVIIEGAKGSKAVVTRTGANSYTVVITDSTGKSTSYSV